MQPSFSLVIFVWKKPSGCLKIALGKWTSVEVPKIEVPIVGPPKNLRIFLVDSRTPLNLRFALGRSVRSARRLIIMPLSY